MAIKSLGNPNARYNAVWKQTGKGAASEYYAPVSLSVTGGNTSYTYGGKKIHVWTSPGPFVVTGGPASIEYFVVAGGGSGGGDM